MPPPTARPARGPACQVIRPSSSWRPCHIPPRLPTVVAMQRSPLVSPPRRPSTAGALTTAIVQGVRPAGDRADCRHQHQARSVDPRRARPPRISACSKTASPQQVTLFSQDRRSTSLCIVVDASGSMASAQRLELGISALRHVVRGLAKGDEIAMVPIRRQGDRDKMPWTRGPIPPGCRGSSIRAPARWPTRRSPMPRRSRWRRD